MLGGCISPPAAEYAGRCWLPGGEPSLSRGAALGIISSMPRYSNVRERILWEYAKLIAGSAKGRRSEGFWPFAAYTYDRLRTGQIEPSALVRENKLLVRNGHRCAYCGAVAHLEWEHIIPRAHGGPDTMDNLVLACGDCNRQKGARDPLAWYGDRRNAIPRLVMGKLLKLLLEAHAAAGTLDDTCYPPGDSQPRLAALVSIFRDTSAGPS